jgi:2'-5' RNA ligase
MRLFFALWPDETVRQELARWARACRQVSGGRLVRSENLHVTLAFVGEVDAGARDHLAKLLALGNALPASGFAWVLDHVRYWPHNRIVHAGASRMPDALGALAEHLAEGIVRLGHARETRPYVAHVTLLRDALQAPADMAFEPVQWRVGEVALVQSVRLGARLAYLPLQRWTLAV